jgi:7-cyano-7-deazaguanine reductase
LAGAGRRGAITVDTPLGKSPDQPVLYSPDVLCGVARRDNRQALGIGNELPFQGEDVWSAYDLTWLQPSGLPAVATAIFYVPATSPNLIESKSLKLYLGSLAMSRYRGADDVASLIERDLSAVAGADVRVTLHSLPGSQVVLLPMPGICIDDSEVECNDWEVDPTLLRSVEHEIVSEELHTHLLRSLCPVTGQPDIGSVLVRYQGPRIKRSALLRYLVSYRTHQDFHEACVERIFVDVQKHCRATELSVYARYNRRGGLDINPFRSTMATEAPDFRLWRQ